MQIDRNLPDQHDGKWTRYNFTRVEPGDSTHVQTPEERTRILAAFKSYTKRKRLHDAYATSRKVDETDPRGPGYRVFFRSRKHDGPVIDHAAAPPAPKDEI